MEKLNSKKEQRIYCKNARSRLDEKTRSLYSHQICEKLLPYLTDKNILSYYPYKDEADISEINNRFPVSLPVTYDDLSMEAIRPAEDRYRINKLNIKEPDPDYGTIINKNDLDVIIVPLLGFDEKRNRLGHGKGYYDRFLKDLKALKIGVAFEAQKLDAVCIDEHDIPLDLIITEKEVY